MRVIYGVTLALAVAVIVPTVGAQDMSNKVAGGGITVKGWTGKIDDTKENTGLTLNDAKFVAEGQGFHITTGPAVTYWNPANTASGNYTVKATFTEPKFQGLNTSHAHPYGIMIAGNDLGTPNMSLLYCSAYGNGTYIVRGFGPASFQLSGRRPEAHEAIKKVEPGQSVTQEVALSVRGDKVECAVNGTVVASYDKASVIGAGKLKSTDGVYGLRFGHNTEAVVTGFQVIKH